MLFYNYPQYDDYRSDESEEFDGFRDANEVYELETYDLPENCPYRQMFPPRPPFSTPGGNQNTPSSPPPNFTPTKQQPQHQQQPQHMMGGGPMPKFVEPGTIRPCTFRFIYIWPNRGRGFWAYLTFVGRRSVSGFRWNGRRWVYFGMDLRSIDSFQCY